MLDRMIARCGLVGRINKRENRLIGNNKLSELFAKVVKKFETTQAQEIALA